MTPEHLTGFALGLIAGIILIVIWAHCLPLDPQDEEE